VGNGITINRHQRIFGFAARELFGDALADFGERRYNLGLNQIPSWLFAVALELRTRRAGALANFGHLIAQFGQVEHLFDIAKAIGPLSVIFARERRARTVFGSASAVPVEEISSRPATRGAALGAFAAPGGLIVGLVSATLAGLRLLLLLLRL
jgi:hypothetical protein